MEKKATSATMMGLLVGLVLVVYGMVMYFANLYLEPWNQYVGAALLLGGIILAVLMHAKEINYNAGFGSLFGFGFKAAAAATVIVIVFSVLQGYIFPDIKTRALEAMREAAFKSPQAAGNEQAINESIQRFEENYTTFIILGIIFWQLILGALGALIGAGIAKKRPKHEFDNV